MWTGAQPAVCPWLRGQLWPHPAGSPHRPRSVWAFSRGGAAWSCGALTHLGPSAKCQRWRTHIPRPSTTGWPTRVLRGPRSGLIPVAVGGDPLGNTSFPVTLPVSLLLPEVRSQSPPCAAVPSQALWGTGGGDLTETCVSPPPTAASSSACLCWGLHRLLGLRAAWSLASLEDQALPGCSLSHAKRPFSWPLQENTVWAPRSEAVVRGRLPRGPRGRDPPPPSGHACCCRGGLPGHRRGRGRAWPASLPSRLAPRLCADPGVWTSPPLPCCTDWQTPY